MKCLTRPGRYAGVIAAVAVIAGLALILFGFPGEADTRPDGWEKLADGLELGNFKAPRETSIGDSTIVVLRIDPARWQLKLLAISETGDAKGMPVRQWCEKHGLTAAINAGMYDIDYRTHIGYMRSGEHINSRRTNAYQSAAAFDPARDDLPPFRIFDLDTSSIETVNRDYHSVVQNLRMIKRPGENRWTAQPKKWSEAALGEDKDGRALFIFCRSPYPVYDFNNILLSLPLGLVAAQHLEGGPAAQMHLRIGERELSLAGSYETGYFDGDADPYALPVPNIIGIVPKKRP